MEPQRVGLELANEIEMARERWAHAVIEELENELALQEYFQKCIHLAVPAMEEVEELALV
jgi:hypothetical protein